MKYRLSLLLAAFLWSTSFPIIKYGLGFSNPFELVFLRFVFAAGGVLIFFLWKGIIHWSVLKNRTLILLGVINTAGFIFQFQGQNLTTSSKAAILIHLNVIFVAFLSKFILKEKLNFKKIMAIGFSLTGVILIGTHLKISSFTQINFKGDMLILLAALSWAFYIIFSKKIVSLISPKEIVFGVMIWTFLFLTIVTVPSGKVSFSSLSTILIALYLGIFCSIIPYFLYTFSLKKITATTSSIYLLIEMVFAVTLSVLFLKDRLTIFDLIGSIFIITGIYLGSNK
ncbi:MAG: DMT family transporter [Candidatus Aminicenantia bacterium]